MNKVERLIEKFRPLFNGSIPKLSDALGLHRSTLHHAMRKGRISTELQTSFVKLAERNSIKLELDDLIND